MNIQTAKEARKFATAAALADADGELIIRGGYYTREYLIEKGVEPMYDDKED